MWLQIQKWRYKVLDIKGRYKYLGKPQPSGRHEEEAGNRQQPNTAPPEGQRGAEKPAQCWE